MTDAKPGSAEPLAEITIRVYRPDQDAHEGGRIYQNRRVIPIEYFSDTRYHGYVGFEFQDMYEDMVNTLKELS